MSTAYVGTMTLADVLPGVAAVLARFHDAIAAIRTAVGSLRGSLDLQVDGLATAKLAIRIAALADLQAQLDASLDLAASLGLSISDPTAAFAALIQGLVQVQADLQLALPDVALSAELSANLAITAELQAKISAFDLVLDAIVQIGAALGHISLALAAAVNIDVTPLDLSANVALFVYDGAASGIGASLQAALDGSGAVSGAATVRVPVLVVLASDTASIASLDAAVRVS